MRIRLNESWTTLLNKFHSDPYGQIKDKRIENWKKLISNLPQINSTKVDLVDEITVQGEWDNKDQKRAEEDLLHLIPWRKGPFTIQDIFIDSEWQSNMKWERVLALNHFIDSKRIRMIPQRIEEISFLDKCFDLVFSMGVLYHQRNPENHLSLLASHLKEGGQIIVETLIAPYECGQALIPEDSYANMSNVRFIHTRKGLENLVNKAGLKILNMGTSVKTTPEEQRSTKWMPFRSLVDGLSQELDRTVEGLPSPDRVVLVLTKL